MFTHEELIDRWPYSYHLTSSENLVAIREALLLESASALMARAGRLELLRVRRAKPICLRLEDQVVWLRDQAPLHAANISFEGAWTFEELLEALNRVVFFWPGTSTGPSDYGFRHFSRYSAEATVIIRVRTADLLAANRHTKPLFCGFNSGSPRYSRGKASPRGPHTFLPAELFPHAESKVVELVFPGWVQLPNAAEISLSPTGPWQPLQR